MDEVLDFLKKCGTYYLATVEEDQPRVRPFGTINKYHERLYIQTGKVKNVSAQLHADPKVELTAFDGKQWLRVTARALEDPNIDAQQDMLDNYPALTMYAAGDGNTEVFYLEDVTATFSSFTTEPRTVSF